MPFKETSRTVHVLSHGSKLCLMAAGLLLVLAGYVFLSGIQRSSSTADQAPFLCQSAANPPTEAFPKSACGYLNRNRRYQAISYVVAALIVGGGGVMTFGSTSREELGGQPADDEV